MPQQTDFPALGQTIAGKYELVRLLGRGETSAVWAAKHVSLGETFALKVLTLPAGVPQAEAQARFQEQAQLSAALSKKTRHVVSVTDHGEDGGWPYVVMELLEGETLETRIGRGPMDPAETADIVGQVARALTVAHAMNAFHGNLVPANIFLCKDEDGRTLVKLLDFGLVRPGEKAEAEAPDVDADTPGDGVQQFAATTSPYASPEQMRAERGLDYRVDLWALVVIGYRCLTGTFPWGGDSPEETVVAVCTHQWIPARERKPNLPYMVEAFFARGFSPELDDRFKSAKELAATLRAGFPHTERAAGGRAAFASRPSFDDEIGVPPRDKASATVKAAAEPPKSAPIEAATPKSPPPPPPPIAAEKPAAVAETPVALPKAPSTPPSAIVRASAAPPSRGRWVGFAVALAVALVAVIAVWATQQN